MTRRRGYVLVMVMFVSVILLVSGTAYLSAQARNYQSAATTIQAAQARALAEAGLEDARSKLEKDLKFPPPAEEGQTLFSYSEPFTDVGGGGSLGSFQVSVDVSLAGAPYYLIVLRSEGTLGPGQPTHLIIAEVDVSPVNRRTGSGSNPDAYRILNRTEEGLSL